MTTAVSNSKKLTSHIFNHYINTYMQYKIYVILKEIVTFSWLQLTTAVEQRSILLYLVTISQSCLQSCKFFITKCSCYLCAISASALKWKRIGCGRKRLLGSSLCFSIHCCFFIFYCLCFIIMFQMCLSI